MIPNVVSPITEFAADLFMYVRAEPTRKRPSGEPFDVRKVSAK